MIVGFNTGIPKVSNNKNKIQKQNFKKADEDLIKLAKAAGINHSKTFCITRLFDRLEGRDLKPLSIQDAIDTFQEYKKIWKGALSEGIDREIKILNQKLGKAC